MRGHNEIFTSSNAKTTGIRTFVRGKRNKPGNPLIKSKQKGINFIVNAFKNIDEEDFKKAWEKAIEIDKETLLTPQEINNAGKFLNTKHLNVLEAHSFFPEKDKRRENYVHGLYKWFEAEELDKLIADGKQTFVRTQNNILERLKKEFPAPSIKAEMAYQYLDVTRMFSKENPVDYKKMINHISENFDLHENKHKEDFDHYAAKYLLNYQNNGYFYVTGNEIIEEKLSFIKNEARKEKYRNDLQNLLNHSQTMTIIITYIRKHHEKTKEIVPLKEAIRKTLDHLYKLETIEKMS